MKSSRFQFKYGGLSGGFQIMEILFGFTTDFTADFIIDCTENFMIIPPYFIIGFMTKFYYIYQDLTEINKISWNPQYFTGFHWNQQDFIMDFTVNSIPVKSVMKFIMKSANEIHSEIHDNPKAHNEKHMLFMKSGAFHFSCVFHVFLTFHVLFTFQMLSLFRYAFHVLFNFHVLFMCFSLFRCFLLFRCAFQFSCDFCFSCACHKKYQFSYKKHHFSWKPTKPGQYVCICDVCHAGMTRCYPSSYMLLMM